MAGYRAPEISRLRAPSWRCSTWSRRAFPLPPDTLDRLTDYLGSLLTKHGYQVVPRSQLKQRLLEKKKESYKKCYDNACQIEIGKELAAQKSLATQIIKLGKTCTVTGTLYDLKRSASERVGTRGARYGDLDRIAWFTRASLRYSGGPEFRKNKLGFRCARDSE